MSAPWWHEMPAVVARSEEQIAEYVPPPAQPIGQPESPVPCLLAALGSIVVALAGAAGAIAWILQL